MRVRDYLFGWPAALVVVLTMTGYALVRVFPWASGPVGALLF